jgi:hypothetical protein
MILNLMWRRVLVIVRYKLDYGTPHASSRNLEVLLVIAYVVTNELKQPGESPQYSATLTVINSITWTMA